MIMNVNKYQASKIVQPYFNHDKHKKLIELF